MRLLRIFTEDSPYKRKARFAAVGWTLLIFIGCLWPEKELPDVPVPMIDKWVHIALFGGFSFLWLCGYPSGRWQRLFLILFLGCLLGWFVEILQYLLPSLGRSYDLTDITADAIGVAVGVILFRLLFRRR